MQPYAMVHGKFASDQEIIDFITEDLKRFENAKNSHNFDTFLLISHLGHHITENIEQLFLNYNVDADKLEAIEEFFWKILLLRFNPYLRSLIS